jgi:hypothetical protein
MYKAEVCSALLSNNVTVAIDQPTLPGILSGDATLCASANTPERSTLTGQYWQHHPLGIFDRQWQLMECDCEHKQRAFL